MASNDQPSVPASDTQSGNVSIRVIALAHSTNQHEDVHLVTSLDTTVSRLKLQIEQNLSQHPRPDTQRLIYQGRPLMDGNATLRQILRLEPASPNSVPVHVIHLVVRDNQQAMPPYTNGPSTLPAQIEPNDTTSQPQTTANPLPPTFNLAQQAFPPGHPAQAMLQNVMQQHMALHNQHHHNAAFPHMRQTPFPMPTLVMPQGQRTQVNPSQPTMSVQPEVTTSPSSVAAGLGAPGNNTPNTVMATDRQQSSITTMRIEETVGPHGEHIRRVFHNTPSLQGHTLPVERSASAPGVAAHPVRPHTPGRPGLAQAPLPPAFPHFRPPQVPTLIPQLDRAHTGSTGIVNAGTAQSVMPSRDPLVFLVSSPTGPEALLFAPNHGFFTSQQAPSTIQSVGQIQLHASEGQIQPHQPVATTAHPTQQAVDMQNDQPGHGATRPQNAGRGQVQAQPGRREAEDIAALVLQRAWLFLRLYMFIFVLSEPGTWRRYILLLLASLICLLPRNNPFTDLFRVARRHFDNLIGPPQLPPRARRQPLQNQDRGRQGADGDQIASDPRGVDGSAQNRATDSQMPTPEEHARRLLREHRERNPSMIRDVLYRVEQAVVLFLASLVPGVGERHVRAREEARRVVQEEEERRRREEEERTLPQAEDQEQKIGGLNTSSPRPSADNGNSTGLSTGVDNMSSNSASVTTTNEGLRMRTDNSGGQAS